MPLSAIQAPAEAPPLPTSRLAAWIAGALGLGLAGTALVTAAADSGWWPAWVASAVIGLVAAGTSLPLLKSGLGGVGKDVGDLGTVDPERKALHRAVRNVLLAGVARVVVFAAGVILSVQWLGTPKWPTLAFSGVLYLLLLGVEVGLVGRVLWRSDRPRARSAAPRDALPQGGGAG
jgi:hypothetical protein